MKKKCELIRELAEECNKHGEKKLCLTTNVFKAKGELYTEKEIEGLITLQNVKVHPFTSDCECDTNQENKHLEWLNIFAEDIIAFNFKE